MAAVLSAALAMTAVASAAPQGLRGVDVAQAQALAEAGVTVIDVRRADEWRSTGVIPGSLLITAFDANNQLVPGFTEAVLARVDPERPIVLVCRSGNRSGTAARLLQQQAGYQTLYNAEGGISEWQRSGRPLAPCPTC